MNKRKILIVVISIGIIAIGFLLRGIFIAQKKSPEKAKIIESIKYVFVDTVRYNNYASKINSTGRLSAYNKVEIISEVSGICENGSKAFKIGNSFSKGEMLIKIDPRETELSLYSQKSDFLNALTNIMPDIKSDFPNSYNDWQNYLRNYTIEKSIESLPEPKSEKEKYFLAARNVYRLYYGIKGTELRLSKHVINAPFDGVVSNSMINTGTMIKMNQTIGEFSGINAYELDVSIDAANIKFIKIGDKAKIYSNETSNVWEGRIVRIGNNIDAASQTVRVFLSVSGANLRDGMYLSAEITGKEIQNTFKLPRKALFDNNYVYIVSNDSILQKAKVNIDKIDEDFCYIHGIEPGKIVIIDVLVNPEIGSIVKPISNNYNNH